jgi:hypothetical protein
MNSPAGENAIMLRPLSAATAGGAPVILVEVNGAGVDPRPSARGGCARRARHGLQVTPSGQSGRIVPPLESRMAATTPPATTAPTPVQNHHFV